MEEFFVKAESKEAAIEEARRRLIKMVEQGTAKVFEFMEFEAEEM